MLKYISLKAARHSFLYCLEKLNVAGVFRLPTNRLVDVHLCVVVAFLKVKNHRQVVVCFIVFLVQLCRLLVVVYCPISRAKVEKGISNVLVNFLVFNSLVFLQKSNHF